MSKKKRPTRSFKPVKKKYIFKKPPTLKPEKHYIAEVLTIRCFDDRCQNREVFDLFMKQLKFRHHDQESPAGGAKVLSSPEKKGDRDFMLREITKSVKLHGTKKIMLFTHQDCGAYGGIAKFGGHEEKEFIFHIEEHRKAHAVVQKNFPKLRVETYFIDTKGVAETTHLL